MWDGGWWAHVSGYLLHDHPWRARISFEGLHDVLRQALGDPQARVDAHCVRARPSTPAASFEHVLQQAGITRHDVPLTGPSEKGADVLYTIVALENALTRPWKTVVLLTGDKDFVPLVARLVELDRHVIVPRMQPPVATAAALVAAASSAPSLEELLAVGLRDDYQGARPFVGPIAGVPTPGGGELRGTITRWDPGATSGSITDTVGQSWFVFTRQPARGTNVAAERHTRAVQRPPKAQAGKTVPRGVLRDDRGVAASLATVHG
ncbi:NYN domain-containing protein [Nonomuraea sp. NPDC049400]|uniref:NYN domain-containing protein n=1 Tax=Nonomuraea sp. NPDC049400 TaxID=3364352 RepID=UPI00378F00DE